MGQISVPRLDNGRYKLYIEYGKTENGSPFSVWQRTEQISDWLPTAVETPENKGKTVYAGEIEITDELKTITLRKKRADDTSVRVYSLLFEKIDDKNK